MIHINTCSFCDCMHSTSKIIDILRADSCHRNTRIFGQINTEFLRHFRNLKKFVNYLKDRLLRIWKSRLGNFHNLIDDTCFGFMPMKQNIPFCFVMCSQLRVDPFLIKPSFNFWRIVIIRSAITLTSPSLKV